MMARAGVNNFRNSRIHRAGMLLALLLASGMLASAYAEGWDLKDRNGAHYSLSSLKGKWVLVNFWAPWCSSCIQEMPDLVSLQRQHKNLQVIGVAVMYRKKQEVLKMAHDQSLSYPIVLGNEDIASEFGEIEGLPTSYLYSPTGKLIGRHEGPLTTNEVVAAMQKKSGSDASFTP
jgi:thiol-disulfide isomerase/thioredoxin